MTTRKLHTDYPALPAPEQPAQPGFIKKYLFFIYGLSICLVCLYLSYNFAQMFLFHQKAENWSATPATVLSVQLKTHRNYKGVDPISVHGSYQYEIAGKRYTANRIQYRPHRDKGGFNRKAYLELEQHRISGEPLTIYINPEDPQQAIIYPKLRMDVFRIDLIMASFFGLGGFVVLSIAGHQRKELVQEYQYSQAKPTEPWRWRPQWQENTILCNSKNTVAQYSMLAIFWNVVAWPASFFIMKVLQNSNHEKFLFLIFILPVIGIFLIYLWWKKKQQYLNHGIASLILDDMPARIGQELQATFHGMDNAHEIESLNITLACTHKKEPKKGKNGRIIKKIIWAKKITKPVSCSTGGGQLIFPFNIAIPKDLPATSWQDDVHKIEWHVAIRPTHKKNGHSMEFEVPVFT